MPVYWLSWYDTDSRPLRVDPPADGILGYWRTGYTADNLETVAAAIEAENEAAAWALVEREWDGPKERRRFSEMLRGPLSAVASSRFPVDDWARPRWQAAFGGCR